MNKELIFLKSLSQASTRCHTLPTTTSSNLTFGCMTAVQPEHVNSWAGVSAPREFGRSQSALQIRRCILDITGRSQEVLLSGVKYEVGKLNLKQRKHSRPLALKRRSVARAMSFNVHNVHAVAASK